MNNIEQKNVIYGFKNSIEIPYKKQEFIDHSDQCDNINLVDVNNLANQLVDNDLYLENYFNYMMNYAEGPKSYDEYTVSSKANGTKFLKDIVVDDSLEILHKVDVPLSGSVSMLLNGKKISLLKQFGDLTIANIDSCGMWSENPANGQWNKLECWLTVVDETNQKKIVRSDVDIEDMYTTENGCYFAADTGVYQLSAQYNETEEQSNVNYVLIKLNIDQTPIDAKSIAVDTKNKKMYVGCKNSSLFLTCDFFENAGAKNNEEKLRFFGQTLFNEHNQIVDTINDILILDDGNVIAAGDKALYSKSSFSNIQISKILKPTSGSAQFNNSIEFAGQLFFGTKDAGLWMLSNITNELIQIVEIPGNSEIMKMVATSDRLYVATKSNIYSINRVLTVKDQNFKNYGIITSLVVDQSFVIVSTTTGLWAYDKNINQPYVFQIKDVQANDIKDMLNVDGRIILASNNSLSSIGFSYSQNETLEVIKTLIPVDVGNINANDSGFIKFISAVGMQIAVFKTKLEVVQDSSYLSERIMYFIENNADIVDAFVVDPILQDDSLEKYIAIATADKIEIVSFNGLKFTHISETRGIKATRIAQVGTQILAIEKDQKTISACSTEDINFLHWVESDLGESIVDLKTFVGISCACQIESGNVHLLEQSKIAQHLPSDLKIVDTTASKNLSTQFVVLEDGQLCAITISALVDEHTGEIIDSDQNPEEYSFSLFETKIFNNNNVQKAKLLYFPNTDQHGLYIVDTNGLVQLYEISQTYLSMKNPNFETKDDPENEYVYLLKPTGYTLGNKIEITDQNDPVISNVVDLKPINEIDENRIGVIFSNLSGVYTHIPHYGNSENLFNGSIKSVVTNDLNDETYVLYTTGSTAIKKASIDDLKSSSNLRTLSGAKFSKLEIAGKIVVALNGSKLYLVNCEKTTKYRNMTTTGVVDFACIRQYYDYEYTDTQNNKEITIASTQSIGIIGAAIEKDLHVLVIEDDEELSNKDFDSTSLKKTFSENIIGVDCIEYGELGFLILVYTATTLTVCYCETSIDETNGKNKATGCSVKIKTSFEFTPALLSGSTIKQALFLNTDEVVYLDTSNNLQICPFDDPMTSTDGYNIFDEQNVYSTSIQNPRKLLKNISVVSQDVWCQTADRKIIKIITQEYIDSNDSEINGIASIDNESVVIGTDSNMKKTSFTFDVEATNLLVKKQDSDDLVPWTGIKSIAWTNGIVFGVGNLGGLSCVNTMSDKRQVVELDTRSFLKCYVEELDESTFKITAIGHESIFEKTCSSYDLFGSDESQIDEPQNEFFDDGSIYGFQNITPTSMIPKSDLFEDYNSSQTIFEYLVIGASYNNFFVKDAELYYDNNAVGIKLKQEQSFVANRFIANASDLDNIMYLDVDQKTIKTFPDNSVVVTFNDEVDEVIQSNSNWHYKKNQNWFYLLDGSEYELPLINNKSKIESLRDIATIGKIEYFGSEKGISKSDYWTTTTISQDEVYNLQPICTWAGDLQSLNFGTGEKIAIIANESQSVTNRKKILEVNLFTNAVTKSVFYPPNDSFGQETEAIFEDIWIVNHDYQQGTYCKPYAIDLEKSDYARWLNLVFNRNLIPYTGVLATGINQIDQYGDNNYILKDGQIIVFNGYRNSQAFSQISSSQFDGDNCYKSLIKTDDGVILAASNKGMFSIKNLDVQLMNQFENIGVVCKHKIENSTVYFYNKDSTILSSENYKIWKPLLELSSGTSKVFDILPFNKRKYLFATDIGLQGTDHKFSLVNDVRPMTKQLVLGLYDNLISADFTSAFESCYQNHIDVHHMSSSTIVQLNNNYATTKLDNILSTWQTVQVSTANQMEFGIKNDIINEMAFGSEMDGDVIVQISNYLDPSDIQYMEEISNSTYIAKRWMSGLTEVFINVPTTRTYYLNNMYGASNCTIDPSQTIYRENLVEFGTAKTNQNGQLSSHVTTLQIGLASAEYSIDNLVDVQINGASLPLKIYQDANTGIVSDSEKMFKSFIEPSILKSFNIKTTDDEGNWLFTFQCFGTDAQAIHLMFYDSKAKQNSQKVKVVFMANGGEGKMSSQKFILVEDSDGNMVLEQKNLKRNRFINVENGNEKIFCGWSIKPVQENSNAQYENREVFPKNKKWKDLARELGLSENQKLKNKDQITLYATWINYQFSNDDTAFVLNSNQNEFRIESIGVDENSKLKEKVIIDF